MQPHLGHKRPVNNTCHESIDECENGGHRSNGERFDG